MSIRSTTLSLLMVADGEWGEILVRGFGYTVAAGYLDNSERMIRDRYSHIEADELGEHANEAINEIDCI